jgi:hypothetical protein
LRDIGASPEILREFEMQSKAKSRTERPKLEVLDLDILMGLETLEG